MELLHCMHTAREKIPHCPTTCSLGLPWGARRSGPCLSGPPCWVTAVASSLMFSVIVLETVHPPLGHYHFSELQYCCDVRVRPSAPPLHRWRTSIAPQAPKNQRRFTRREIGGVTLCARSGRLWSLSRECTSNGYKPHTIPNLSTCGEGKTAHPQPGRNREG